MKTVLVLVLSADFHPYDKMIKTAMETWDSEYVGGVDTLYYCGESDKTDTDKIIYLPVKEDLYTMGHKCLQAFEWVLANMSFDYIARTHSSCYVDKERLIEYIQTLPDENVFAGAEVTDTPKWMWGGGHFVLSRDVVQKIVDNKDKWDHSVMEDKGMSYLVDSLGIPFTQGKSCSINKFENGWVLLPCGSGNGIMLKDWSDIKQETNHFYRVKQDGKRELDEMIMKELFKCLY
jgi:hypothetical protein